MTDNHIRHIPIVDDHGGLVGLVTHRDILRAELSSLAAGDSEKSQANEAFASVTRIMSKNVQAVSSAASLKEAGLIMQGNKIGCLPVVDDGKVVGIITDSDFVGAAISIIDSLDALEELR